MMKPDCDKCKYEVSISRIEAKIDGIDEKLDRFLEKTIKVETQMGSVLTGFVVIGPIVIGAIIYILERISK
jgi:preprotein translocase subunit SecY